MNRKVSFILLLLLQVITILVLLPDYIPSWEESIFFFHILSAIVGAVWLGVLAAGIFNRFKVSHVPGLVLTTVLTGLVLVIYTLMHAVAFYRFHFTPLTDARLVKEEKVNDNVFYIYDDSWQDPATRIKVQTGWMPFEKEVGYMQQCPYYDLKIKKEAGKVTFACGKESVFFTL